MVGDPPVIDALADNTLDGIYILNPDPWPKKRHWKRRMISPWFFEEAARLILDAVGHVRGQRAPALLRLTVPRLEGHSFQDTQGYKSEAEIAAEWARDPLPKLKAHAADRQVGDEEWQRLEESVRWEVDQARRDGARRLRSRHPRGRESLRRR